MLGRRELRDLADALSVEDVHRVEVHDGRLLEVVDGGVFEDVPVQVAADEVDDRVAELMALCVEIDEVELLADGLQSLGELRTEERLQRPGIGGARAADGLGDLDHVVDGLVHPHEEGDLDVGADVVAADQAVLGAAVDLDRLHGDVHHLRLVDDRQDRGAGERHFRLRLHLVDDQGLALFHLPVELGDHHADDEDRENEQGDADDDGDDEIHGFSLLTTALSSRLSPAGTRVLPVDPRKQTVRTLSYRIASGGLDASP